MKKREKKLKSDAEVEALLDGDMSDFIAKNDFTKTSFKRMLKNKKMHNKALSKFYGGKQGKTYKSKCQHCARHTFSTNFVGMIQGDFFLAKMVLGHKDMDTTMRYVHIFEAINRKIKTKGLKKSGMALVE